MLDYKEIPLTQGKVAIVDAADYDWLMQWRWQAQRFTRSNTWYAKRGQYEGSGRSMGLILMHRVILDAPVGIQVDRRDGDGLNNRRSNLRLATESQNKWNVGRRSDNTSGFKGVSFDKSTSKWRSRIHINGKSIYLGLFESADLASAAYDAAAMRYQGEFIHCTQ